MNLIRDELEAKLDSECARDAGLKYTQPQDTLRYWRKADNTKGFPVYVRWGGRTPAGVRSRLLRVGYPGCRGTGADADRGPVAAR